MNQGDFNAWIANNPEVWALFKRFTFELINAGHRHGSSDMILHRIRWETAVKPTRNGQAQGRDLKLNNNWTAFLARKFHEDHPEHIGFFRTRQTRHFQLETC